MLKPDRPSLPSEMLTTLLFSFLAFFLVYVALLRARYDLAVMRAQLGAAEAHASEER